MVKITMSLGTFTNLHNNPLVGGASGGLYVDAEGHAIGLAVQIAGNAALAQPFRSEGVKGDDFEIPPYDLILGAKGQKSSYRQQVKKYIVGEQKADTWLRRSKRLKKPTELAS